VTFGALCAGLVVVSGCKGSDTSFGPPKPATVVTGGGGGGGNGGSGGSGGSGGQSSGGTGGGTTSSSTTGTGLNPCECELAQIGDTCGMCTLDTHKPGAQCVDAWTSCNSDPSCTDLLNCPVNCFNKPDQGQCIHDCFVNAANPQNSVKLATAYLACACGACAAKCQMNAPLACQ
jgi:hypothetical protein